MFVVGVPLYMCYGRTKKASLGGRLPTKAPPPGELSAEPTEGVNRELDDCERNNGNSIS